MYYGQIKYNDIANGTGVRTTLFVSGCTNKCEGCFQPQTWDFCYGKEFTSREQDEIIKSLKHSYIAGLTLLGGEPFEPQNQRVILPLVLRVRKECPTKSIWCFTGFTLEELTQEGSHCRCEVTDKLLANIDVLVDGRFIQDQKDISLRFRGSRNQRIIDLQPTLNAGKIVLWDDKLGK